MDIEMTKNRAKELAYYLFFGLMVFAKGIGLDSGRKSYYVLSAAACICIFCKLILTKYNIRQILAVGFLGLLAFAAYRNSGRMGILLTVLAIIGIKDMDIKKLFRLGLAIYGCSFAFTIIAAKLGLIYNPMAVHEKGGMELIRWGMGYSTGNVFHVSYFMLTVYLCYTWGRKYNFKKMLVLMAGNLAVFFYSLSYTGILVTAFYLLISLYAAGKERAYERKFCIGGESNKERCAGEGCGKGRCAGKECGKGKCAGEEWGKERCAKEERGKRRWTGKKGGKGKYDEETGAGKKCSAGKLSAWERILCQLPLPLCLLFSLGGPFLLDNPFMQKVNVWLQARLAFSAYFLQNQPITLFGARMKNIPNFWIIMDNGYVYIMMTFGLVAFGLFCAGYAILIARYSKKGRLQELAMIFSFLLYGIMEQFISNAFMNLSLLFMGEVLFGTQEQGEVPGEIPGKVPGEVPSEVPGKVPVGKGHISLEFKGEEDRTGGFRLWLTGLAIGIGVTGFYLALVPRKEYVAARLDTVLYVDAQSVQIGAENEGNTEEGLMEGMESFRELATKKDSLEIVIGETGLEERISAEELAAAMEFSVPAGVKESGRLDTFRMRILELYCDISEEEYGRLLEGVLGHTGMPGDETVSLQKPALEPGAEAEESLAVQQEQQALEQVSEYALPQRMEDGSYTVKGGIYAERVGRSFGEDRIEHISGKEQYFIEKTGSIVKLEHYRDGVFWGIAAAAVWFVLYLANMHFPVLKGAKR
jgi:hypothetical protein